MARRKDLDLVIITCYGQSELLPRKKAIDKYLEAMMCSEGAERDRYVTIYYQLLRGMKCCDDRV